MCTTMRSFFRSKTIYRHGIGHIVNFNLINYNAPIKNRNTHRKSVGETFYYQVIGVSRGITDTNFNNLQKYALIKYILCAFRSISVPLATS